MIINASGNNINWHEYINSFGLVPYVRKKGRGNRIKREVLNLFCAFDIETTTLWLNPDKSLYDVHGFMYKWQMQIEDYTISGRTWEEFLNFLKVLKDAITQIKIEKRLDKNPWLVLFVHNLAFEWQFMSGIYNFRDDECFFRDKRKPLYCQMFDTFEFRCSYMQTNLSLSALCKQTGVKEKLSGQKYDYDKIRFPWTELTDYENEYCNRDVSSLVEAMKKRVIMGGDTLITMPLTSTGYVRRECKEAIKPLYLQIRSLKPEVKEYRLLRKCFRGGNSHANRYYVNMILDNVFSYDIGSSYPAQQLTHLFPMKPFRWLELEHLKQKDRMQLVLSYIGLGFAVCGTYYFEGLCLKNQREPIPYISLSKCDAIGFKLDNGRILYADTLCISCCEIDLDIILRQYEFKSIGVSECMVAKKDYLPKEYRNVILDYYHKKTLLKGDETEEGKYMYTKSKNMLNSIYGMSATDPIHQEVKYNNGDWLVSGYEDRCVEDLNTLLKNAPFPYQWGVYTTALARYQLQNAIDFAGDKIVYCDTDSIKTIGKVDIDKLNEEYLKNAIKHDAFADDRKGIRHYCGIFEKDAFYDKFITQGAKRYAFYHFTCKYHNNCNKSLLCGMGITVAGVTKKVNDDSGFPFACEELQKLENFRPGMIWDKAGGTTAVYNDDDDFDYIDPETGKSIHITKNIAIVPSTYEMGYSKDYKLLLDEIELYGDYKRSVE